MPKNPSIPRSQSAPKISGTTPLSSSSSDVPPPPLSFHSDNSSGTYWPRKLGDFLARKGSSSSSFKNPKLTEQSLKEFNRLNEILEEKKCFSPYYRGLTDSSLVINQLRNSSPSPDTESHAAASLFSSSSKGRFVVKMQEWGTSFFLSPKKKEEQISQSSNRKTNKSDRETRTRTSSSSTPPPSSSSRRKAAADNTAMNKERTKKSLKMSISEKKQVSSSSSVQKTNDVPFALLYKGKPLRERVSQPPSPPPTPPHPPLKTTRPPLVSPLSTQPPAQTSQPQLSTQPPPSQPPAQTSMLTIQKSAKKSEILESETPPADNAVPEEKTTIENDRKYIWADKYRPFTLKDFLCNRSKALELQALAKSECCGHYIFEGPPGVGKRTMIWALLREIYGPDKIQAREESKKFILKGEAVSSITVNIKQSPQHVEVDLSELRGYEKHIIVELIKERHKSTKGLQSNHAECRAIILYEAEKLPTEAHGYIKWILERYKGSNKLFFCCRDASKIQPLIPLCSVVQLLPPSTEEIIEVLEFIAKQEEITLPHQLAEKIAKNSKNNLRQAIRSFEATWHFNSSFKEGQEIMTGWEDDIATIAKNIIEEQSPKQLYNIRGKLQNLIEHNVSPEFIFETLIKELKKNLDKQLQKQIDNLYEKYHRFDDSEKLCGQAPNRNEEQSKRLKDPVRKTVQQFMRIEEFVAKFMSWYKGSVIKNKETQQAHAI